MARVYAPASPPGPIKLSLVGLKLSAAIARTKAEAFVAARDAIPKSFIGAGLSITVLDRPTLVVVEGPGRWNQHVDETPAHWVPVSAGYDPRPQCYAISSADECNPDLVQVATPTAFGQHLGAAALFARDHHAKTAGHVIAYAWSEWSEGGIIEPMPAEPGWKYYGDEMAVAAASVT